MTGQVKQGQGGAVVLCLFLERIYRNGIGSLCAATSGFVTLLIAYNLQLDGDTLEMLRAVLPPGPKWRAAGAAGRTG